jgi:hypothetical protein
MLQDTLQGNHRGTLEISGEFFTYKQLYNYASVHT